MLLVFGMFIALSFFAHPQTDDFNEYADVAEFGIIETITQRYDNWTGRYTYVTVESIILSRMDLLSDFWAVGLGTMSLLLLSMFTLVRTVTRGSCTRGQAFGLTAGLFIVYLVTLPTPARAFYWLTGAVTNQLVLILSMFAFALILRDPTGMSKLKRASLIIAASILMSGAIGAYDNTLPVLDGILLGATGLALVTRDPRRLQVSIVFIVAVISSVIVMIAPGNAVRQSFFEQAPLMQAIDYSITNSLKWLIPFLLSPTVVFASLLYLPTGWRIGRQLREMAGGKPWWMMGVVGLWGVMIMCSWLPAQYVMQGNPPPRTLNTISLFTLIGLFGTIAAICAQAPDTSRPHLGLPAGFLTAARFIFAAIIITHGNGIAAAMQLKNQAQPFHQAMQQRYDIIRQAKANGETDILIPQLPVQPTLLLPSGKDISPDPMDYPNYAASRYWQVDTIRMEEPTKDHKDSDDKP